MDTRGKNEPFVTIEREKYWKIIYQSLKDKTKNYYDSFEDWYESDNSFTYSYLFDYKAGIRIMSEHELVQLEDKFAEDESLDIDDYTIFYFRVIDRKKYLWAKLKYEI